MNRLIRRIAHNQSGFSLTELLATILILTLATSVVATGIPVAQRAYEKVVVGSNAQLLLSTTIARLREELGSATYVDDNYSDNTITYQSGKTGFMRCIKQDYAVLSGETNPEAFKRILLVTDTGDPSGTTPLVSVAASTDLHVTYQEVARDESASGYVIKFTNLKVIDNDDSSAEYASLDTLEIRVTALSAS